MDAHTHHIDTVSPRPTTGDGYGGRSLSCIYFGRRRTVAAGTVYGEGDLPQAKSAGSDIGISMYTFIEKKGNDASFAAVLLHETAHPGGATTNPSGKQALEAENALIPCGLKQHFLDSAKG